MRYLSLCSGIEAASVAWEPLGWQAVAFAEIEPFPCAVLAYHYPDVPNLGDMTKVQDWRPYHGAVDLVVGGTPCQDFSIAGQRAGLAGERGGLALVFTQILSVVRPEWVVWENVPGVFSTNGGRDFGAFLRALDDIGYSCAWRVLDAQSFGVPQRRRRVYIVGHLGDWRPAAAVLFEPQSLRRDTPPSRKEGTDAAAPIKGGAGKRGWENGAECTYIPHIVEQAMSCKWAKGTSGPAGDEYHNLIVQPNSTAGILCASGAGTERSGGQGNEADMLAMTSTQNRGMNYGNASKTDTGKILRVLRQEVGEETLSKWGLGVLVSFFPQEVLQPALHGTSLRPAAFSKSWMVHCALSCEKDDTGWLLQSLREAECERCTSQGWKPSQQLARELGAYLQELSQPGPQAEKFMQDLWEASEGIGVLRETLSKIQEIRRSLYCEDKSILGAMQVRRLTVTECEFLMGFPRNYTNIDYRGKPATDGPRYRALGNSMAVPVMRWIGQRIENQTARRR